MKSKISVSALSAALGYISPAISSKSPKQIHTHALLSFIDNKMYITGNNGSIEMNTAIPSENSEDFTLTVDFARLSALVNTYAKDSFVTLTFEGGKCKIKCLRATGTVATLSATEYPKFEVENQTVIKLDNKLLSAAINRVAIASAKDDTIQTVNGVCINFHPENGIDVVATDKKRLHVVHINESSEIKESGQIILPIKTIGYLKSVLESTEDTEITYGESNITIKSGNRRVVSPIIQGIYPDFKRVIPKVTLSDINLDASILKTSLNSILAVAENVLASRTKVTLSSTVMELSTINHIDATEATDSLAVDYNGNDMEFGIAPKMLKDAITMCGSNEVKIGLCDNKGTIKIENDDFISVVTPVIL